jgi:hypothetical protein
MVNKIAFMIGAAVVVSSGIQAKIVHTTDFFAIASARRHIWWNSAARVSAFGLQSRLGSEPILPAAIS